MEKALSVLFITWIIYYSYIFSMYFLFPDEIEVISMHELRNKDDYHELVVRNNNLFARRDINKFYKVQIPNVEYVEKHLSNDIPLYFEEQYSIIPVLTFTMYICFFMFVISLLKQKGLGILEINNIFKHSDVETTFDEIIGQNNAKRSVKEFVDILNNREKYNNMGVTVPKGLLLSGPPGTGKTLLAKAIAGECRLPFINVCGSDFSAMFVGVGSSRVKSLFDKAKEVCKDNKGCIIFIDEIDTLAQKRSKTNSNNREYENTLNQLLSELDGFESNENILTIGATNRVDVIDNALLRPGRMDRKVIMDVPVISERIELFNYYFNKLTINKEIIDELNKLSSKLTPGFTGAEIANVVNESGIIAIRNNCDSVNELHVKNAIDYVMLGDIKENILTDNEKKIVAYHETGHAILSCILDKVENPVKVSILPRERGMLGFSQSEASDENLVSKEKLKQQIMVLMGGRVAEELFCNDISNGASNDIERATELSKQYVDIYGFGKNKFINTYNSDNDIRNDISNYSKDNSDKEKKILMKKLYSYVIQILYKRSTSIHIIVDKLLKKETLYYKDLKKII